MALQPIAEFIYGVQVDEIRDPVLKARVRDGWLPDALGWLDKVRVAGEPRVEIIGVRILTAKGDGRVQEMRYTEFMDETARLLGREDYFCEFCTYFGLPRYILHINWA